VYRISSPGCGEFEHFKAFIVHVCPEKSFPSPFERQAIAVLVTIYSCNSLYDRGSQSYELSTYIIRPAPMHTAFHYITNDLKMEGIRPKRTEGREALRKEGI
jgi:hypothetical protein